VIVNTGGAQAGVAAFRQDTGELAWKSEKFRQGYPSPMIVNFNGEDHLILALAADRIGLDPATGQTRWKSTVDMQLAAIMSSRCGSRRTRCCSVAPTWRNAVVPDQAEGKRPRRGSAATTQNATSAPASDCHYAVEAVWHDRKLKVMHGTIVKIGDYVYGSSGDFARRS